jgi:hypothetical protein
VLNKAAIRAQNLTVDPDNVWPGKEGHNVGYVFLLAEAFQREEFAQLFNLRIFLTGEEAARPSWI